MSQPPFGQGPGYPPGGQPQQPGGPGYGGPPGGYPQQGWGQQPPQGSGGGNSNTPLIIILVVLLLAGGGMGVFFLTQDDDEGGGGGEASAEEQEYIDALSENPDSDDLQTAAEWGLTEDDLPCLNEAVVVTVGGENIPFTPDEVRQGASEGWEPELTLDQGGVMHDRLVDCGADFRGALRENFEARGLSASQLACVDENLTDEMVRDLMAAGFAQDQAATAAIESEFEAVGDGCQNA